MKPKTAVLMIVAISFGGIAAYMVSQSMGGNQLPEKVTVLVPKKDIPMGTIISDPALLKPKEVGPLERTPLTVTDFEQVRGKLTSRKLSEDHPFQTTDVVEPKGPQLERGQRAVTIRVDVEKQVAGFVQPGRRVDIVQTTRDANNNPVVRPVLQNVLVVAADLLTKQPDDKEGFVGQSVTFAVTPEEGLELTRAKGHGEITLMLRPSDDPETIPVKEEQNVTIWVARSDLEPGTVLTEPEQQLKAIDFPKDKAPDNAITNLDLLRGKRIHRHVTRNQFLTVADLVEPVQKKPPVETVKPKTQHVLTIINGPEVKSWVYEEGKKFGRPVAETETEEAAPASTPPAPASPPKPPADKPPADLVGAADGK
ncbi:MAG: Flp pilus assembly protein CpaB [Gemmataceae bacterium]|nr:Flp pilus assembly protein CpaB [Gemmataceae bacterium]MDW8266439.1 Flp pilus assembly protein CpaB [Gemmataceae bacterium]